MPLMTGLNPLLSTGRFPKKDQMCKILHPHEEKISFEV
jgi:hypothetical protein